MVNDTTYLVVMVVCLDSPLVIQDILKVLKVSVFLVVLIFFFLDLMVVQQKSCPPLWASLYAYSQGLFPLEFVVLTSYQQMVWANVVVKGASVTITIEWGIAIKYNGINLIASIMKLEVLT